MSEKKNEVTPLTIIKATEAPVDITALEQFDYGVTSKYERKNYDSQMARKKFHEVQFKGKKTITGTDGEILHKSHNAAKTKYGEERASYHQAEADHKDPIKNIHKRVEENPIKRRLLTDQDIKEVANREKNFQELPKHENASKGDASEFQRGVENHDVKRAIKGLQTQAETDAILTGRAARNAAVATAAIVQDSAGAAINAGRETALVALTVSGLNNLVSVASGEKSLETALKDVASDAASSFVSGASIKMAQETVVGVAELLGADQLANFVAKEFPSAEIAMAVMTFNTMKRYLDGNISAEDCAFQIIANGAGTLAYQLGMVIGGPAGAIIASVVMTQITHAILQYKQEQKLEKAREAEVNRVLREAMAEVHHQHDRLKEFVGKELKRWDDTADAGFNRIFCAVEASDAGGIAEGLNTIMTLFAKAVPYSSLGKFDKDFFNTNSAPLIL